MTKIVGSGLVELRRSIKAFPKLLSRRQVKMLFNYADFLVIPNSPWMERNLDREGCVLGIEY